MRRAASTPGARRPVRGRGRPPGGDAAVRDALLDTARRLFLAGDFRAITIRQIAAAAGSSSATIHYHFGNKLGLYRAMLETALAPVIVALESLGDPQGADAVDLGVVIRLYSRTLAENPWVPVFILREVFAEGGRFRGQFIENFAGRLAPLLVGMLRRAQARGAVRADLDPQLAALSAISLTVFPFLSLPVTSRVLGVSVEGEALDRLVAHNTRLLLEGIHAQETGT